MLTHHILWRIETSKLLRCYHPVQDIVLYTDLVRYQPSVFLQRTISVLYSLYDGENFKLPSFFLKMGEAFIAKVFLILLFKIHVVSPLIVKNK